MLFSEAVAQFMSHDVQCDEWIERRVSVTKGDLPSIPECIFKGVSEMDSVRDKKTFFMFLVGKISHSSSKRFAVELLLHCVIFLFRLKSSTTVDRPPPLNSIMALQNEKGHLNTKPNITLQLSCHSGVGSNSFP